MPLFRLRLTFSRDLGDVINWNYAVDGPSVTNGELGALIDGFQLRWASSGFNSDIGEILWTLLEAYEPGPGPAVAVEAVNPPFQLGSLSPGNEDVALAVASDTVTTRGRAPTGRNYYGPYIASVAGTRRPSDAQLGRFGAWAVAWHQEQVLQGFTPVVISRSVGGQPRATPVGLPIVGYSADDTWDTMRSRGQEPTKRLLFTP